MVGLFLEHSDDSARGPPGFPVISSELFGDALSLGSKTSGFSAKVSQYLFFCLGLALCLVGPRCCQSRRRWKRNSSGASGNLPCGLMPCAESACWRFYRDLHAGMVVASIDSVASSLAACLGWCGLSFVLFGISFSVAGLSKCSRWKQSSRCSTWGATTLEFPWTSFHPHSCGSAGASVLVERAPHSIWLCNLARCSPPSVWGFPLGQ